MTELISVTVNDGKYTIQQVAPGRWECLRYGEHWPGMGSGPDNLHVAMAYEIHRLRSALTKIAAYEDTSASKALETSGYYGLFDEPGSVAIARAALEGKED